MFKVFIPIMIDKFTALFELLQKPRVSKGSPFLRCCPVFPLSRLSIKGTDKLAFFLKKGSSPGNKEIDQVVVFAISQTSSSA
jgi:hypothetical protein